MTTMAYMTHRIKSNSKFVISVQGVVLNSKSSLKALFQIFTHSRRADTPEILCSLNLLMISLVLLDL